jgi:hypothetical protein
MLFYERGGTKETSYKYIPLSEDSCHFGSITNIHFQFAVPATAMPEPQLAGHPYSLLSLSYLHPMLG